MLKNVMVAQIKTGPRPIHLYEGLNARPKVYLSKEYFCEMYPTCVSSKLCEFILTIFLQFFTKLT